VSQSGFNVGGLECGKIGEVILGVFGTGAEKLG